MLLKIQPIIRRNLIQITRIPSQANFSIKPSFYQPLSQAAHSPSGDIKEYMAEFKLDTRKLQSLELIAGRPTNFLHLFNLPPTTTPDDIYRICKEDPSLKEEILQIVFPLNHQKQSKGICALEFSSVEAATKFGLHCLTYYLSAQLVRMKFNSLNALKQDQFSALRQGNGNKVLISGLPKPFDIRKHCNFLNGYKLAYEDMELAVKVVKTNPLSVVSSILVELDNKSQAYLLMHNLNHSYFNKSRFGNNFPLKVNIVY